MALVEELAVKCPEIGGKEERMDGHGGKFVKGRREGTFGAVDAYDFKFLSETEAKVVREVGLK